MKKYRYLVIAGLMSMSSASMAWECVAMSPTATGFGFSPWLGQAKSRALFECGIRTPWGMACYIQNCNAFKGGADESTDISGKGIKGRGDFSDDYEMVYSSNPEDTIGGTMDPDPTEEAVSRGGETHLGSGPHVDDSDRSRGK